MTQEQTMVFALGCCFVLAVLIGGIVTTELLRKLAREREKVERLRRMNSRNYHHRKTMQRAWFDFFETPTDVNAYAVMHDAAKASRDDHE